MSEVSDIQAKIDAVDSKIEELGRASSAVSAVEINIPFNMEGILDLHVAGDEYDRQMADESDQIMTGNEVLNTNFKSTTLKIIDSHTKALNQLRASLDNELIAAKAREEAKDNSKKKK